MMTLAKARIKNPRYWSKLQPRGSNLVGARRANVLRPKAPWSLLSSTFAQGRLTWGAGWRRQTMLTPNTKQKPNLRSLYTDHNRSGRAGPGCSGHAARAGVLRDLTCFPSSAPGRPLQDTVPADAAPPNAGAGAWCHSRRFLPAAQREPRLGTGTPGGSQPLLEPARRWNWEQAEPWWLRPGWKRIPLKGGPKKELQSWGYPTPEALKYRQVN